MKIRTKLTIGFLACGLAPLLVGAAASYWAASSGLETVRQHAS